MSNSDQSNESHADGIIEAGNKAPSYFYLLFFGLIAWGIIFMGYYLFSGWSSSGELEEKMASHNAKYSASETAPATNDKPMAAKTVDAAALFSNYCSGCHGDDGKGGFGSDLSAASYTYGKDAAAVKVSIADGRGGGKMPAFSGQLSTAEINALVEFSLKL